MSDPSESPIGPVRAVVLDYGGVMTTPVRDSLAACFAAEDIRPDSFTAVLREWLGRNAADGTPIHRLETGALAAEEFERLIAPRLVTGSTRPVEPAGLLGRLFAEMADEPAMATLVRDLRTRGVATGLLSNSWGNAYPRATLDALFDAVVISEEVRLRKPDPRMFATVLDRLGVQAGETVFVDDARSHVDAANALGLRAVLHVDPATTRTRLAALVPGLDPAAQEVP
ncbi:MAG: HAD family hydrolase [Actinomycetes bacterium]